MASLRVVSGCGVANSVPAEMTRHTAGGGVRVSGAHNTDEGHKQIPPATALRGGAPRLAVDEEMSVVIEHAGARIQAQRLVTGRRLCRRIKPNTGLGLTEHFAQRPRQRMGITRHRGGAARMKTGMVWQCADASAKRYVAAIMFRSIG